MKKKIISVVLAVALFISVSGGNLVFAVEDGMLTALTDDMVNQMVNVRVELSGNPGVAGIALSLNFDKTKLTPVSITKAPTLGGAPLSNLDQGGDLSRLDFVSYQWVNPSNITENGTLFTVQFKAIGTDWTETELHISYRSGDIANQAFEDVNPNTIPVTVKRTYTITYDANGGKNAPAPQSKLANASLKLSENIPEKSGYTFIGWSEQSQANASVDYRSGASYAANRDIMLYAVWFETSKMPVITVDSVTGREGETIDVPIRIENNFGIAGFVLNVGFDKTKLTPVSAVKGNVLQGDIVSNIDQGGDLGRFENVYTQWSNASNITENGTLYTLKFKIADGCEEGAIPLQLSYEYGDIANQAYDTIYAVIKGGKVDVVNIKKGDIFGDDVVNSKDAIKLAQCLAKWDTPLTNAEKKAADLFQDGVINSKDAIKLAQYLAKWDVEL